MNHRRNMLEVLQGQAPQGLLFVPRLDIWYNRNKARGTLPPGYEHLTLCQIADKLGVGFHSVVPDFLRSAPPEDLYHRALGFYNNPEFPYRVDFSRVDFDAETTETQLQVIYRTPVGHLTTRCAWGQSLLDSGVSIPDILEHAVKTPEDYLVLADILSNVSIHPTPTAYERYHACIGDTGLAVAFLSLACSPMQHILRDLRKFEAFCFDLYDCPAQMTPLCDVLARIYDDILAAATQCSAEVALFGANYDEMITYPPFFDEHCAPWLRKAADIFHANGQFLLTHVDGENQRLLPSFQGLGFDVADSICPYPMTKVTLDEYRRVLDPSVTIWGGIPSILTLPTACSESDFRRFVDHVIESCAPYDHLILSIADTTPPDADFNRILYLRDVCAGTFK